MLRRLNIPSIFETLGGFLLAIALLAMLFASFSRPASGKSSPQTLALLPGSAEFVVSLDTFALRKSDLVAEMEKRFDSVPEAAENYRRFVRETGVDPRQDTDQVLMALRHAEGAGDSGFLIIAQGRFGSNRLVDLAQEKGGSTVALADGTRVWSSRSSSNREAAEASQKIVALAQPDQGTVLFGQESEVLRALDVLAGRKPPEPKGPKLRELLSGVDRRAPAWAVLNSSALAGRLSSEIAQKDPSWNPGDAVSRVESVTFMGWAGKDVTVKARVTAKDLETAGLLADVARGALAAGKLAAKDQDQELLRILQETKLTQDGTIVEIEARIPASRFQLKPIEAAER